MRQRFRRPGADQEAPTAFDRPTDSRPGALSPDDEETGILAIVALPADLEGPSEQTVSLDGSDAETLVLNGMVVGSKSAEAVKADDAETVVLERVVLAGRAPGTDLVAVNGGPRRGRPRRVPRATPPRMTPRRMWVSRAVLLGILIVQAALTLRMHNTAFEDEAQYLYAGHMELAHWINGAPLYGDFSSYFSGTPVLYPVLGAVFDTWGGLFAARLVSLFFMLSATGLLYSMTRRLFNERVGLFAAGMFSVTEATLFMGDLATFDAPALCLLALAAWIVVRTAHLDRPFYLLAAPVIVLAAATKYAALLFMPTIVVLAALAALPYWGRRVFLRTAALTAAVGVLIAACLALAGSNYVHAIQQTTTARAHGSTPIWQLLRESGEWGGWVFLVAVLGAVLYVRRPRTEQSELTAPYAGPRGRLALGVLLAGSTLLAPAYQFHLATDISLQKHVGFGLLFAAPMAGVGMARVIGDHYRRVQVGIAVWAGALILGMTQASFLFAVWPNSSQLVAELATRLRPGAAYLIDTDQVPIYYLMNYSDAQPLQFISTYSFTYTDKQGQTLSGQPAYEAAIRDGYFQVVVYDFGDTPELDTVLARDVSGSALYRLAAVLPEQTSYGTRRYYVWVQQPHPAAVSPTPPQQQVNRGDLP